MLRVEFISELNIGALRDEAAEAGDTEQVKVCDRAIRGSVRAAKSCMRAMRHAAGVWAAKIVRVEGGYKAFESLTDYRTWKAQR